MKILDRIPILWFALSNKIKLLLRKSKYLFQNTNFQLEFFDFEYINSKGVMVIRYKTKGLLFVKIQNLITYKPENCIILNLENLDLSNHLKISFYGSNEKHVETIEIFDFINSQYNRFHTQLKPKTFKAHNFQIKNSNNSLGYSFQKISTTNLTPKYKLR